MAADIADLLDLGLTEDAIRLHATADELRDVWPRGLKGGGQAPPAGPIVLSPATGQILARVMAWAAGRGLRVQVQGGRSNVVGALDGGADVVLDTSGLAQIGELDPVSQTISVGAGVLGARLESFLGERGLTLGHYPQSLQTSTVGGWVATRATGTASALYGGIERLVCGLEFVLPGGELVKVPARPRPPGGLDAIALLTGSEGSLAVITEVTLSVSRQLPETRLVAVFPSFEQALEGQRALIQSRIPVAVLRTMNATESAAIARPATIEPGACLLIASLEAEDTVLAAADGASRRLLSAAGGRLADQALGESWWQHRYAPAGLIEERNLAPGMMFDTIEVGASWSIAAGVAAAIEAQIAPLVEQLWLHASHAYQSGTCLYLAFWIKAADDRAALERCAKVWQRTLGLVVEMGGSHGHHHGIGAARSTRFMETAEGRLLRTIKTAIDPQDTLAGRLLDGAMPRLQEDRIRED